MAAAVLFAAFNLLPLFGIYAWGWDAFQLLLLYWGETVILFICTLGHIALIPPARLGTMKRSHQVSALQMMGISAADYLLTLPQDIPAQLCFAAAIQDALDRWWGPLMQMHGPRSPREADRDLHWRIKAKTSEELRQEFLTIYVPRIRELAREQEINRRLDDKLVDDIEAEKAALEALSCVSAAVLAPARASL